VAPLRDNRANDSRLLAAAEPWSACGRRARARYHRAMLLCLDIGNTNITLGLVQGETIIAARRATTSAPARPMRLEVLIDNLLRLDGASLADVTAISLASVVPTLNRSDHRHVRAPRRSAHVAGPGTCRCPSACSAQPKVGADRLVNALAVARLYGTPAIVVDFGTGHHLRLASLATARTWVGRSRRASSWAGGACVPYRSIAAHRVTGAREGDRH